MKKVKIWFWINAVTLTFMFLNVAENIRQDPLMVALAASWTAGTITAALYCSKIQDV